MLLPPHLGLLLATPLGPLPTVIRGEMASCPRRRLALTALQPGVSLVENVCRFLRLAFEYLHRAPDPVFERVNEVVALEKGRAVPPSVRTVCGSQAAEGRVYGGDPLHGPEFDQLEGEASNEGCKLGPLLRIAGRRKHGGVLHGGLAFDPISPQKGQAWLRD